MRERRGKERESSSWLASASRITQVCFSHHSSLKWLQWLKVILQWFCDLNLVGNVAPDTPLTIFCIAITTSRLLWLASQDALEVMSDTLLSHSLIERQALAVTVLTWFFTSLFGGGGVHAVWDNIPIFSKNPSWRLLNTEMIIFATGIIDLTFFLFLHRQNVWLNFFHTASTCFCFY